MAEEVKAADVEMAEATPEKKPEVTELPIEDIEDLNSVSLIYFFSLKSRGDQNE